MKITGHKIREAIEAWKIKRDLAKSAFAKSLFTFEDEEDAPVLGFFGEYNEAEEAIVRLQCALGEYNLKVMAGDHTLAEAVKKVGVLTRYFKMWDEALKADALETSPWDKGRRRIRNKDDQIAQKNITDKVCRDKITAIAQEKNKIQGAIAIANATTIELDLDEALIA